MTPGLTDERKCLKIADCAPNIAAADVSRECFACTPAERERAILDLLQKRGFHRLSGFGAAAWMLRPRPCGAIWSALRTDGRIDRVRGGAKLAGKSETDGAPSAGRRRALWRAVSRECRAVIARGKKPSGARPRRCASPARP